MFGSIGLRTEHVLSAILAIYGGLKQGGLYMEFERFL